MSFVHVKGLDEIQRLLDQLPAKFERNLLRGGLRAGANVIKAAAQDNVAKVSGNLARSLKVGTRTRRGEVTASVRTKVFYARFVEYGTRPHVITARDGGALAIGGGFYKSVEHPGIANPRPFMRPAMDTRAQQALLAVGTYIKERLSTHYGLDTAHIQLEGDE